MSCFDGNPKIDGSLRFSCQRNASKNAKLVNKIEIRDSSRKFTSVEFEDTRLKVIRNGNNYLRFTPLEFYVKD